MIKQKLQLPLPLYTPYSHALPKLPLNQTSGELRRGSAVSRRFVAFALLLVLLLAVACGPGADSGNGNLEETTATIARDFAASGDIESARAAVQGLDVANPMQWLIYSTETAISSNSDPALTQAYVRLALEMGVRESTIRVYAEANGMIESSAATAASGAATIAAAVLQPVDQPVVEQPAVVEPAAETRALTDTTAPVTGGVAGATAITTTQAATQTTTQTATVADAAPAATENTPAQISTTQLINLREGPGTEYNLAGSLAPGETAVIVAKNGTGDWWQIRTSGGTLRWVYGALVNASGAVDAIALASDIPTPPPATIAPTPASPVEVAPADPAPAEPAPADPAPVEAAPEATAAPAPSGTDFQLIEKRLWSVYETGGRRDGPTVTCGEKRELVVLVIDANGNALNNVAVQAQYGAQEIFVTGSQGKGDGRVEFVLGSGQDVRVIRDGDREVTSDLAAGMTTDPRNIPFEQFIAGQYCDDNASCDVWVNNPAQPPPCFGHFSWTVTYKRNY